jgi:hypothetical protein
VLKKRVFSVFNGSILYPALSGPADKRSRKAFHYPHLSFPLIVIFSKIQVLIQPGNIPSPHAADPTLSERKKNF